MRIEPGFQGIVPEAFHFTTSNPISATGNDEKHHYPLQAV